MKDVDHIELVKFIEESNKIEGIPNMPKIVKQHIQAFEYLMEIEPKDIIHNNIREMHSILMEGLIDNRYRGCYRGIDVWIAGHKGCTPEAIHSEMSKLLELIRYCDMSEESIWYIHDLFEVIHCWVDGNGRSGRLLLNWLRVKGGLPIKIILDSEKYKYYKNIEKFRWRRICREGA